MDSVRNKSRRSSLKNPIHRAVINCNYESLVKLLSKANIKEINDNKRLSSQALNLAARRGDYKSVKLLLNYGAMPNFLIGVDQLSWSKSILGQAIQNKKRKIIKLLINQGCCDMDATLKCDTQKWNLTDLPYNHWSKVLQLGDFSMFQFLIKTTGRQICDDDWNRTLLLTACHTGCYTVASYLIDQGVPINAQGPNGETGMFYALAGSNIDIFEMLVERGADCRIKNRLGLNLLHIAACNTNKVAIFRNLLDLNLEVNLRDQYNRTPLHYAVLSSPAIVELLIERGADLNVTDLDGRTPFHYLFTKKTMNYQMISLLVEQEDINLAIADNDGVTILHHMAANNNLAMCIWNVLKRTEVDINARDKQNRTPLHYLLANNRIAALGLFIDLGADTEALHSYWGPADYRRHTFAIRTLMIQKIMYDAAGLRDDNINDIVKTCAFSKSWLQRFSPYSISLEEVSKMKITPLVGRLTYFDFLHAKRRLCMAVAKMPNIYEKFICENHKFSFYARFLFGKYLWGLKEFTKIESEAITNVDKNLNIVFNNCLPNLIIHFIKKYIDIEDAVTLQACCNATYT